jgi:hypothetical protein
MKVASSSWSRMGFGGKEGDHQYQEMGGELES